MHDRLILILPAVGTTPDTSRDLRRSKEASVEPYSRLQEGGLTSVKKKNSYGESAAFSQKQHNRYKNGRIGSFCTDSR